MQALFLQLSSGQSVIILSSTIKSLFDSFYKRSLSNYLFLITKGIRFHKSLALLSLS